MSRNAQIFSQITDAEADGGMSLCYLRSIDRNTIWLQAVSNDLVWVEKKSTSDSCGTPVGW